MRRVVYPIAVIASLSAGARAETAPPLARLLAQPGELARWLRESDPVIDAQHARVEAAQAAARQSRVIPNPQLNFGVGDIVIGKTNSGNGGPGTDRPRLSLDQTLQFNTGVSELVELGKRGPRQSAADLRVREATEVATGTLGIRLGDAAQVLGKLAYLASRRGVVAANLDAAKRLMALEKVRLEHSDLSALEFARIELDTRAIALALSRAESDVAAAVAACSAALYLVCAPDGLDDPTVLDAGAPLPGALPLAESQARAAIEARPARVASKLETEALGWDATLAHNRRIPDPTFGAGYTLDNLTLAGNQHQTLMFTIGIPLPIFDRGDHDEAAARATAHAIAAEDLALVRQATGQIEALVAQRAMLEATIATLTNDAVPKSTQIVERTRRAFDLGQAPLADLLLAERAHRDLLLELLDTRFDLFNVRAQLRRELGLDDQAARDAGRRNPS